MKKTLSIFIIILLTLSGAYSQSANLNSCIAQHLEGFMKDGQNYNLKIENSKSGKVYLSFFQGFQYRLVICSSNAKNYKITLYDIEKKVLFSSACNDYSKTLDFVFKSNIACIAEITVDETTPTPGFTIALGFKEHLQNNKKRTE